LKRIKQKLNKLCQKFRYFLEKAIKTAAALGNLTQILIDVWGLAGPPSYPNATVFTSCWNFPDKRF